MEDASSFLIGDLEEALQGEISSHEKKVLAEAHKLFHLRFSGPLPWHTQVAMITLLRHMHKEAPQTRKVASV
jgi:hypothetical protein